MKKSSSNLSSLVVSGAIVLIMLNAVQAQEAASEPKITFDDHAKAIFQQHCSSCHGGGKKEADLDVTNYTAIMLGGGSGEVIAPGSANDSYLYRLVTHAESPEMPPSGTKIPDPDIKLLSDWINQGALENTGSKPRTSKPKTDLALSGDATVRPETVAFPLRMPLEPVIKTTRPTATAIATSPWAKLAAIAAPKQVLLYSTETLELLGVLPMEEGLAHTLKFSRNGSLLLGGGGKDGQSGKVIIWDVSTGRRITAIGDELDAVLAADISSNQELVALGGPNKLVKVFSVADGSLRYEINKHTDWVTALEFSPDGKFLATGDRNGGLQVWETASGAERFALPGHTLAITGVSWRADSMILASASEDTTVRLWEMEKGGAVKNWGAHGAGTTAIDFLRDGNLTTCGRDQLVKTWDQNGTLIRQFPAMSDVAVAVSYCDETGRVIGADWKGQVYVWNAADGVEVGRLIANPPLLSERLVLANQNLNVATAKHLPLLAQVEQTKLKLVEVSSALSSSEQNRTQMIAKIAEMEAKIAAAKQLFESTSAQQATWQIEQTEKMAAQPLIAEAYQKTVAAAQALPADTELQQSMTQLESKKNLVDARLVELGSLVAKSDEEKANAKKQMDELAVTLQADSQSLATLTAEVTQLQSQIAPLATQAELESQTAAAAAAEMAAAQQQIEKWNSQLEFIQQLDQLNLELQKTEQVIVERQTSVSVAQEKLRGVASEVEQAQQQQQATEAEAESLRVKILQLQGG